jgi:hypothetical protein
MIGWAFGRFWLLLWLRIAHQPLDEERGGPPVQPDSVLPKNDG